jgi:hypothetical protein
MSLYGRRTASPLHAPRGRPSPGAARRPLPARERRLFVASLETAGSFRSAHSTEQTLPAGDVGATRWVARRGRRWAGTRDDAGPSCTIAPGRRTASPLHALRGRPSPGAARRPLPGRERRLVVASLETGGSFRSAHPTEQTLPGRRNYSTSMITSSSPRRPYASVTRTRTT